MNKPNINLGIEIECSINGDIKSLDVGDYHEGISIEGLSSFTAETDGSLRYSGDFGTAGYTAEIVSKVFRGKKAFIDGLKAFKNYFSENGTYELKEVLCFNSSCGSHLHFSIDGFKFTDKSSIVCYKKVRRLFFQKIEASNISSKERILRHYNRDYATLLEDYIDYDERYKEFNFTSEREGYGLEWRSLNMLNIQTWSEFMEFWKIVYSCLESLWSYVQKWIYYPDSLDYSKNGYLDYYVESILIDNERIVTITEVKTIKRQKISIPISKIDPEEINILVPKMEEEFIPCAI